MKICIVGKGGTGKTLISATLARVLGQSGANIIAVDLDSNPNLGFALGLDKDKLEAITPIVENEELVNARTGLPGAPSGVFKINPKVNDLIEKFGTPAQDNVLLLIAGYIAHSEQGCMCSAHSLLKALLRHIVLRRDEYVVLDVEAGLEVFGRGTLKQTDIMIIVTDPSIRSLQTVGRIVELAKEEDFTPDRMICVVNKLPQEGDSYNKQILDKYPFRTIIEIPVSLEVIQSDISGKSVIEFAPDSIFPKKIRTLVKELGVS